MTSSIANIRRAFGLLSAMLAFVAVLYGYVAWRDTRAEQEQYLSGFAEIAGRSADAYFRHIEAVLGLLAGQIGGSDALADSVKTQQHLEAFLQATPDLANINLVDIGGQMRVSAKKYAGDRLPLIGNKESFSLAVSHFRSGGQFEVARALIGPVLNTWVIPLRYAIRDRNGELKFVITAALPINRQQAIWQDLKLPANAAIGLLRDDSYLVSRYPVRQNEDYAKVYGEARSGIVIDTLKRLNYPRAAITEGIGGAYLEHNVYALHRLEHYPITLFVGFPVGHFWSKWWERVQFFYVLVLASGLGGYGAYRWGLRNQHAWEVARDDAEERIGKMAFYDVLTGLPNRSLLIERFKYLLAEMHRHGKEMAVLFIDLDRFKIINDTLGHRVGDELLGLFAARLRVCVREVDTVSRLGGDEFVLLLPETDVTGAKKVAEKILESMKTPVPVMTHLLSVTPSIGISLYPHDGKDPDSLLKNADAAMYFAKDAGRNNYRFFTPEMDARVQERAAIETGLRIATQKEDFVIHYQPFFDLRSRAVTGAEALLRWRRSGEELVYPERFIRIAEESGLILPIGELVLNEVCRQIVAWRQAGFTPVPVAINLSAKQFHQPRMVEDFLAALEKNHLEHAAVEIELTESAVMRYTDQVRDAMQRLSRLGVRFALDDFGTGYSSLTYLRQLPVDKIKIDHSFVRDITVDKEAALIVRAIAELGRSLGLRVIAEGIETELQLEFLVNCGCHTGQGFYFSKALPAQEFEKYLTAGVQGGEQTTR
jgi:diguanylate cyclase (GGDEF)-like protein